MLEVNDLLLVCTFTLVISGCFAVIGAVCSTWWLNQQMLTGKYSALSARGVEARIQKAERMEMAMGEAMQRLQAKEDPKKVLTEVGMKYPDVAFQIAKKGLKLAQNGELA